jgi:potassium voltage-gated channel Shab-related subfamily B protein 2
MKTVLNKRVKLNVGGVKFEILRDTLHKVKKGRLWKISNTDDKCDIHKLCDDFNSNELEFFFDRDPTLFGYILNYYRLGRLHISESLCPVSLNNELIYWDLDQPLMDVCCEEKLFNKEKEVDRTLTAYLKIIDEVKMEKLREEKEKSNEIEQLKTKIWNIVDDSFGAKSSFVAKVFTF